MSQIRWVVHLLCWIYFKDFYGRLCWRYVGKSDINYSIRIDNNRNKVVDSKKEEEIPAVEDLKQIKL
jgi:hypothetical protein